MAIILDTGQTLSGVGSVASKITYTIYKDLVTTGNSYTPTQGQLPASVGTLYTSTGGQTIINAVEMVNTDTSDRTATLYIIGTGAANQITPTVNIYANGGMVCFDGKSLYSYSATGLLVTTTTVTFTGDVTGSGSGSIVTTIANGVVSNAKLANMTAPAFKGRTTAGTGSPEDLTATQATAMLNPATTALQGLQSAKDKLKEDNLYYDVTANAIATLVGDDATDNSAAWATLFAGLPVGATVYFPSGTYRLSTEFTISADKHLRIMGAGKYATTIKSTSTTAHIFHINGQYWYNSFQDMAFTASVTKTAGACIFIDPGAAGAAVGTNIARCSFSGTIFHAINATGAQAANLSIWEDMDITSTAANSRGLVINGSTINLVISNSTANFGSGAAAVAGSACMEVNQSGSIQMLGNDFIGGINTILVNANQGGSTSIAAILATNCFLDQSGGSTLKITGANIANRIKFVQCGITGGNVAGAAAVEIASTGTGAAGTATAAADGIDFIDCDIYPNGGSGTLNGFLITGAQGVSIQSCRISGWTNGIQVTPVASNGYTKIYLSDNKMGATNNFTTPNTVGVLLNAGSFQYGSVGVNGNDFTGSTTPITDNSTVASANNKSIGNNLGIASPGGVGTLQVAVTSINVGSMTVLSGSSIALATGQLRVGSRLRWVLGLIKTAAGAATWSVAVKFGTSGTSTDAAIATWTSGTNTAAIDQATLTIEMEVTAVGASATAKCVAMYVNTLTNATGLGNIAIIPGSTAAFNANATSPFLHVDVQAGTSAVMTGVATAEMLV